MKRLFIFLLAILSVVTVLFITSCGQTEDDGDGNQTIEICPDGRHEFSVWKILKEATCTELGLQERSCLICKQYKEQQQFKNSTNHDYVGYVCSRCGDSRAPLDISFVLSEDGTYYILNSIDVTEDATANDNTYTVPSEYNGLPVKEIAKKALKDCTNLEEIVIPDTIEKIGEGALMGCYKIKKLTIPFVGSDREGTVPYFGHIFGNPDNTSGLQPVSQGTGETFKTYWISPDLLQVTVTGGELYEGCFENCANIKAITYTGSAEEVHTGAFKHCTGLDKFEFPITLSKFGDYAFYMCEGLDVFPLNEGVEEIGDYCFAGVKTDYLSFPSTLTKVGEFCFADCNFIKNVVIPSNIERLSNNMFEGCSALETVTLQDPAGSSYKIKSIGRYCFLGCELLNTVSIPKTVEEIREGAFYNCVSLKTINLPSSLTKIDTKAFSHCESLEEITIANGLERIESNSFEFCTALTTVNIPSSIKEIGENAFIYCSSLVNFTINPANSYFMSENGHIYSPGKKSLILVAPGFDGETLTIPEGVQSIEGGAFANATSIKSVVFPSTLQLISANAFNNHPSITSITINANMQKIGSQAFAICPKLETVIIKGVDTIDKHAFAQCKSLKYVEIDSVGSILDGAFYLNENLSTIKLSNIDLVGQNAFADCKSLVELNVGENVKNIGTEAFAYCSGLETVVIAAGNEAIGEFAFSNCIKLKTVVIGEGCVSIGEAAFEKCTAMTDIEMPKTLESINAYAFQYCTALVNVKIGLGGKYAVTRNSFIVEIDADAGQRTLVIVALGAITEELTIPNNIHAIGPYVFRHVKGLKKVNFPETLTSIGREAFFDSGLTEIDFYNVETVGDYAFGQTELTSVTIGENVKSIGKYAFQYCYNLTEIYIRSTVESVGTTIFHNVGTEEIKLTVYLEFASEEDIPSKWSSSWLKGAVADVVYGHSFN